MKIQKTKEICMTSRGQRFSAEIWMDCVDCDDLFLLCVVCMRVV